MIPTFFIGSRNASAAQWFIDDLKNRLAKRVRLTSDGHKPCLEAIEGVFGGNVDHSMLIKMYSPTPEGNTRYSPAKCVGAKKKPIIGRPVPAHVSTSYAERQNLTMRMSMRRFTRLTNRFSKKVENHAHSVALHFMWYNFGRVHKTLLVTPAMEAGISDTVWTLEDVAGLVDSLEKYQPKKRDSYKKRISN